MAQLTLSPKMLEWVASKVGRSLDELAQGIAAPSKLDRFRRGLLTTAQAEKLASLAHIPFGYLFLDHPPILEQPELPDFRQLPDAEKLSDAFYETLSDVLRKKDWFGDHLREIEADSPKFVGKFEGQRGQATVKKVAKDITDTLGITPAARAAVTTHEAYYTFLSDRLEAAGALVFKSGIVKSNTHWPLSVSEFRGFAIADSLVPIIFVNGRDTPAAWVFTLIHEAAHLWLGVTGVSDSSAATAGTHRGIEATCNEIAAEVLTPADEFTAAWNSLDNGHLSILSRRFRVSQLVIARRALDKGFIDKRAYVQALEASKRAANDGESGGNPYYTIPVRNSKRFTRTVVSSAMSGETLLREAGSLLHVTPGTVAELGRRNS